MNVRLLSISGLSLSTLLSIGIFAAPQKQDKKKVETAARETVARPMTEKERRRKEEKLRKELETPYRKWLNEDVAYIISDEERTAFKRLQTDEEREQFIEQFWLRRDPTPDSVENEFKEEHYRRIAYANETFASGIPGWKTDRGRIYITFGPPDEKETHPSGGSYERPPEEGGGSTSTFPFEQWRYRYIEEVGSDIIIEFVDPTMSGEYRMTMDPSEKDALLYVPNAGLTLMEQMGMANKTDRFNRTDGTHLGVPFGAETQKMNQFNRLEQFAKLQRPPAIKFKDLEGVVNSRISYGNILPMKVRVDFFPLTDASVVTFVTLQLDNKDLQFHNKEGMQKAQVDVYGKFTTMTRRIVANFEESVEVTCIPEQLADYVKRRSVYNKSIPLAPGTYRLNVVAKDRVGGNLNAYEIAVTVPRMDTDKLMASNIVLADLIEHVPTKSIGMGQFVIGTSKVRPRLGDTFKNDEKMGIYFKIYNFGTEGDNRTPTGEVTYEVTRNGTNEKIFEATEDVSKIPGASANQVTIEKLLPLNSLVPGTYTLRVRITDKNRNQTLTPSAQFTVT